MGRFGQDQQIIWLHSEAPAKPVYGAPCNSCGVCCAASPCPVSRVFLWQWRGACRALEWHADLRQYRCGMLLNPEHYLPYLPLFASNWFRLRIRRWIAVETFCDSYVESSLEK